MTKNQRKKHLKRRAAAMARNASNKTSTTRSDGPLKSHFRKHGVIFGFSPDEVVDRFESVVGSERWHEWQFLIQTRMMHGGSAREMYDFLESAEEANFIFSQQADISLAVAEWLNRAVAGSHTPGASIADLGCGTGILSSWFAEQYTDSQVIGYDSHPGLLRAAKTSNALPNLSFKHWDYSGPDNCFGGRHDILVSSLGVDYPMDDDGHMPLESCSLRASEVYQKDFTFIAPYFDAWRKASSDDANLFLVLRVASESMLLAAVDAASDVGWQLAIDQYDTINVDDEYFPALSFTACSGALARLPEDTVLAAWLGRLVKQQAPRPFKDAMAVTLFEALSGRVIVKEATKVFDCGNTMRSTVGVTSRFSFLYSCATTGFAALQLLPLADAATLEPKFDWE